MVERSKLDEDPPVTPVDPTLYRSMVSSLMYLTACHPHLVFVVCMCARYQAKPTEKHFTVINRVFRYQKGTINMGLSYLKDIGFKLTTFADAYHACCQDTRRSDGYLYKSLARERFKFLINRLGMQSIMPKELKHLADSEEE
ncbi:hypothetical protein Tco_1293694 [Tanacetum coccineum]